MAGIKRAAKPRTGYEDFLEVAKKFRKLSFGVIGGGAVAPFAAYVAGITPPWPHGITLPTALVELVVLILVFQFFRRSPRKVINKVMRLSAAGLFVASALYLSLFSFATFEIGDSKERDVKGFVCVEKLPDATRAECPFVGQERLKDAAFHAELIWRPWSIQLVRLVIVLVWLGDFLLLSTLIGTFVVFQTRPKNSAGI
jgi:hypothetical protein